MKPAGRSHTRMPGPPRKKYRRHESEVSCCLKYLIFGFNVIFWVRYKNYNHRVLCQAFVSSIIYIVDCWHVFLDASTALGPLHSGRRSLGLEWEGNPVKFIKTNSSCSRSCLYTRFGGRIDICNWVYGMCWCSPRKHLSPCRLCNLFSCNTPRRNLVGYSRVRVTLLAYDNEFNGWWAGFLISLAYIPVYCFVPLDLFSKIG